MTITQGAARANVRQLLDDLESVDGRWSDASINTALHRAAVAAAQLLVQSGWSDCLSRAAVALSNGIATVPANDGIANLFVQFSDGSLTRILPGNGANRSLTGTPSTDTILVEYWAKTVAPAGDGYTITYAGVDVGDVLVDSFVEYLAASDLKTVEGEQNPLIIQRLGQLEAQIRAKYNPSVQVAPAVRWTTVGRTGPYRGSRWFRRSATQIEVYR